MQKGIKSFMEQGVLSVSEYTMNESTTLDQARAIARGTAKGRPYFIRMENDKVGRMVVRRVIITVYRDEVAFSLGVVSMGNPLEFYSRCVPDIVN